MTKIITDKEVTNVFKEYEIALITGSFDVLHLGHLRFFSEVSSQINNGAKILVVILSNDEIQRRKGSNRPIFSQVERAEALSYIETVDFVYKWQSSWEDLRNFVKEMKPKYLAVVEVDSEKKKKKRVIESVGGKLIEVKKVDNFSSSDIIKKLGL